MKWLLKRMLYELEDLDGYSSIYDEVVDKYAKMAEIQAKVKYGDVFTIEDFIEAVESGGFIPYDGFGYYWDENKNEETEEYTSFNVDKLKEKSKTYKYVVWYNK
jgi:hypothetical protein